MRDKTHDDFVVRWANFVKDNPDKWQKKHAEFINAQIENHREFLKRLLKTPGGREKIIRLYGIKNLKGYNGLLQ